VTPLPHLFFGPVTPSMLGLPTSLEACVFELDGVLANSIAAHRAAWAETFDRFLLRRASLATHEVMAFDPSRTTSATLTVARASKVCASCSGAGASASKSAMSVIHRTPRPFTDSQTTSRLRCSRSLRVRVSRRSVARASTFRLRGAGLRRAVVSVSENTGAMLDLLGLSLLLDTTVDGEVMRAAKLRIRPEPDTFLTAAERLGAEPGRTAVFVHDLVGVSAALAGGFGYIVGVERSGRGPAMLDLGADRVVRDVGELMARGLAT